MIDSTPDSLRTRHQLDPAHSASPSSPNHRHPPMTAPQISPSHRALPRSRPNPKRLLERRLVDEPEERRDDNQ